MKVDGLYDYGTHLLDKFKGKSKIVQNLVKLNIESKGDREDSDEEGKDINEENSEDEKDSNRSSNTSTEQEKVDSRRTSTSEKVPLVGRKSSVNDLLSRRSSSTSRPSIENKKSKISVHDSIRKLSNSGSTSSRNSTSATALRPKSSGRKKSSSKIKSAKKEEKPMKESAKIKVDPNNFTDLKELEKTLSFGLKKIRKKTEESDNKPKFCDLDDRNNKSALKR